MHTTEYTHIVHTHVHTHTKANSLVGYEILGAAPVLLRTEIRAGSDKGPETRKWWVTQTTIWNCVAILRQVTYEDSPG